MFVWERNTAIGKDRDLVAPPNYLDWQAQNVVFDALGAYRFDGFSLTGAASPKASPRSRSSSLFRVLGVDAALGRTFTDEEERRRDRVVVLRHQFWQRRFGGDPPSSATHHAQRRDIHGRRCDAADLQVPGREPGDLYSPVVFLEA